MLWTIEASTVTGFVVYCNDFPYMCSLNHLMPDCEDNFSCQTGELQWSNSETQIKTALVFQSYWTAFELFLPVLEEISFESLMWISFVDVLRKRREALCLAVSEGALPNIQTVSLCSLLLCYFTFDNCEGKGGRVLDS